jgi:hypothetical protein
VPPGAALVLALKVDGASVASFTIAPDGTITASSQGAIPSPKARSSPSKAPPRPMPTPPKPASP